MNRKNKFRQQKNKTKNEFYKNKKVTEIDKIGVNKILVSKEELCGKIPQMTGYVRTCDNNLNFFFKIRDKQLLKKNDQIWKRTKRLLKKVLTAYLFMVMMKNT